MSRNDFRKALTKIEEDPRVDGKKLQTYLIMPIQRIPRYIMLIQNLMNYSTEKDDMTNLYSKNLLERFSYSYFFQKRCRVCKGSPIRFNPA